MIEGGLLPVHAPISMYCTMLEQCKECIIIIIIIIIMSVFLERLSM